MDTDPTNWLDLAALTPDQQDGLLMLLHDSALQKEALAKGDPRVFIIYDSHKQAELFRLVQGRPTPVAPDVKRLLATALAAAPSCDGAVLAARVLDILEAAGLAIVAKPRPGWVLTAIPATEQWPPYEAADQG